MAALTLFAYGEGIVLFYTRIVLEGDLCYSFFENPSFFSYLCADIDINISGCVNIRRTYRIHDNTRIETQNLYEFN